MSKILFLLILPFFSFGQKIKTNEYDKFLKQYRIEFEPLSVVNNDKARLNFAFAALSSNLFLEMSGQGLGASTIDVGNEAILLFSNDSTISIKSLSLQSINPISGIIKYKHQYSIKLSDLEVLKNYDLVGIRKYSFDDYIDLKIPAQSCALVKRLSEQFLEELKRANVIKKYRFINQKEVAQYIGDSVTFCSQIFSTRYYDLSPDKPTLLDVQSEFATQPLQIVVWEKDRKNFGGEPEKIYNNKKVCISGVVQLVNNIPQIQLYSRKQIKIQSPITEEEAIHFIGDSVTLIGVIASARYLTDSKNQPTLLNMGAAFPNQNLTLVIEAKDRRLFTERPEQFFINKKISVSGYLSQYKDKPQMVISRANQIKVLQALETAPVFSNLKTNSTEAINYEPNMQRQTAITTNDTETLAEFPGGANAWMIFLNENLICPEAGLSVNEKKKVVVSFVIDLDGSVNNIQVVQSGGKLYDDEVIRTLRQMPKWKPRFRNGNTVMEKLTQTISFNCSGGF